MEVGAQGHFCGTICWCVEVIGKGDMLAILPVLLNMPGDGNVLHQFVAEGRGVEAVLLVAK